MFSITKLIRPNIKVLKPYSSARDDFSGKASVFLDANENPFNTALNRYPDPQQKNLKERIAGIKGISPSRIFLGNGSDEAIDLLFRAFCEPGTDNVIAIEPSYGMYGVCAGINDIDYRKAILNSDFSLNIEAVQEKTDTRTKMVFLCSPNNPTGNCLNNDKVEELLNDFRGLVIVDEAYIDFAPACSVLPLLNKYPNLVVLQTLSKAWGLAGIRLGMAFASEEIIQILNRIKYPYNINVLTIEKAMEKLQDISVKDEWVQIILEQRARMIQSLNAFPFVQNIYPSDANFLLVQVSDAISIYQYLVHKNIIVRNRSTVTLCEGCLRITIGTEKENNLLMDALHQYQE